ncbi:hypothetical protein [Alteromonas halophila]|uniref:Sulfotransferase family protein n=1 Tax=Alteromonas halophila TaxID=516698 RepID=A0A918JPE1_9ALTE|nr:hypothetical protein [Alteromonas halophila]GGW92577.1 hypothetical protein GCM10007391_28700 [Alteromonas halophila]
MAQALSLLSVPGTDSRRFLQTLQTCLSSGTDISLTEAAEVVNQPHGGEVERLGIFLCDPAVRLKQSYDGLRQQGKATGTFADFYSKPARINYLSKQLAGLDISSLGFVGLQESYAKSLLMAEIWTGERLSTVSPTKVKCVSHQVLATISTEDYAEIQRIHAQDYTLYAQVKSVFEQCYENYQRQTDKSNVTDKRLLLHLGPPKTGTSAVQSWLLKNRSMLRRSGIEYPQHHFDENGISSGNFTVLLSNTGDDKWAFDDDKASRLVGDFARSDDKTLLLSSEHFFYSLPWLFSRFPLAHYIFYIRHPLSLLESNYHQHVKRHRADYEFLQQDKATFEQLSAVSDIARQFSVSVTYRYLERSLLVNGSLIDDFLSLMSLSSESADKSKKVNTQYRSGALELMRVCNRFLQSHVIDELDRFLQFVSESQPAFSLIEPDRVVTFQRQLAEQARLLTSGDKQLDADKLQTLLSQYTQPEYLSETARIEDMQECLRLLAECKPALARSILEQAKKYHEQKVAEQLSVYVSAKYKNYHFPFLRNLTARIRRYFR